MSLYSIKDTTLTAIGDAIRAKNGSTETYTSEQMAAAIEAIVATGGGGAGELACYAVTGTNSVSLGYVYDLTPYLDNDFFYLNWIRASSASYDDYFQVFIYHAADGSIEAAPFGYNPMATTTATAAKAKGTFVDGILTLTYKSSSYAVQSTGYIIPIESTGSSSGGIAPEGEIEITENGTYDVTEYASALVNVAASGGGTITTAHKTAASTLDDGTMTFDLSVTNGTFVLLLASNATTSALTVPVSHQIFCFNNGEITKSSVYNIDVGRLNGLADTSNIYVHDFEPTYTDGILTVPPTVGGHTLLSNYITYIYLA